MPWVRREFCDRARHPAIPRGRTFGGKARHRGRLRLRVDPLLGAERAVPGGVSRLDPSPPAGGLPRPRGAGRRLRKGPPRLAFSGVWRARCGGHRSLGRGRGGLPEHPATAQRPHPASRHLPSADARAFRPVLQHRSAPPPSRSQAGIPRAGPPPAARRPRRGLGVRQGRQLVDREDRQPVANSRHLARSQGGDPRAVLRALTAAVRRAQAGVCPGA